MKKIIVAFTLLLSVTSTFAQKEAVMIGAGTNTCKEYMEATQNVSENEKILATGMYVSWLQGYLSGKNRQLMELGYKAVNIGNVEEFGAMLTFTCANAVKQGKGSVRLFLVIDNAFEEDFKNKVKR